MAIEMLCQTTYNFPNILRIMTSFLILYLIFKYKLINY
jgi:hypothetical protein